MASIPRFKELYTSKIIPVMMEKFKYSSIMAVPTIQKITLNMGLGKAVENKSIIENAVNDLFLISGRRPVVTHAKNSIATFKIRQGMPIGAKVTLRRTAMYEFLDRLVTVAIPRIRDFRGLSNRSFDGRGNYSFGVKEQIIFPEIDYDKIDSIRGLDVCITSSANTNDEMMELLHGFSFPLRSN